MWVDQAICERFSRGEEAAFSEIVKKYEKLVFDICKEEFESGKSDVHLKMSQGYKHLIEDVKSEVWISLLKRFKRGIVFEHEYSLVNLIRDITKKTTKTIKRKSIRNRNPAALSKNDEVRKSSKSSISNIFKSTNHKKNADQIDSKAIDGKSEIYLSEDESLDFAQAYAKISEKLSSRQQNLVRLMESQVLKDEKATHPYLAEKLGVSERTVRNDLETIRQLYKSLDPSIFMNKS